MKKKILCLIDILGMGGAERQMIGLTFFLKQKGYDVDLITYYDHDYYSELVTKYGLGSITLHVKNSKLSKLIAIYKQIKNSGGYDWVIAFKDGPCSIGCILKIIGVRFNLIVSERNTTQVCNRKARSKFFLYRFADYIVPNSLMQEDFIKKNFHNLADKTKTITNFTDTDYFKPSVLPTGEQMIIMTAARISKQKNVLNYLKAIKILKEKGNLNVRFVWYGDVQTGEEEYGDICFAMRIELGIEEMISFYSATTNIVKHYQECNVFCLPSIYEGFPNVICEAMSCGKAIICSRVCDNPLIVEEYRNGLFFDPLNVNDMADKLQYICTMTSDNLNIWGENSKDISESLFSKEAFVNNYIKLIESL